MSIDYSTLLGNQQTLRWARAVWRYSDSADIGKHFLRGQSLPAGALLIGSVVACGQTVAWDTSGSLELRIGDDVLQATPPLVMGYCVVDFARQTWVIPPGEDQPITLVISDSEVTAGLLTVFLAYIPNTTVED